MKIKSINGMEKWKGKWKKKLREGMVRVITPLGVRRPPR